MSNQVPCLVFLLLITILILLFGGYYTYMHDQKTHLESCYHSHGKCMEVENCPQERQSLNLTTCIHKRKVCCMPTVQPKRIDDALEYSDLP